jgi:hypothetical protein
MYHYTVFLHSVLQVLITANAVPTWPILVTMMIEAICSSDTSVLTRATRRNIPEAGNLLAASFAERCWV